MNSKNALFTAVFIAIFAVAACSRVQTLTPDMLSQAEARWNNAKIGTYHVVIEMQGDRVEKEQFEARIRDNQVEWLKRNGQLVKAGPDQDYSMTGLFRVLRQELDLAKKPTLLGAPEGYTAYPMAAFDQQTGRLVEFRRTVGGTSNSIHIRIVEFTPGT